MADYIDSLTPEQEAQIPAFRDEWLKIGLSTERADRPNAEAGIERAYKAANLGTPNMVFWGRSPYEGAYIASVLTEMDRMDTKRWDQIRQVVIDKGYSPEVVDSVLTTFYDKMRLGPNKVSEGK